MPYALPIGLNRISWKHEHSHAVIHMKTLPIGLNRISWKRSPQSLVGFGRLRKALPIGLNRISWKPRAFFPARGFSFKTLPIGLNRISWKLAVAPAFQSILQTLPIGLNRISWKRVDNCEGWRTY